MSDCLRARRALERRFEGELALEESLWLDEHAAHCSRCRAEEHGARRIEDALQSLRTPPVERLDVEGSLAVVRRAIASEAEEASPVSRRPWTVVAAAAAVFLLLATYLSREAEQEAGNGVEIALHPAPPVAPVLAEDHELDGVSPSVPVDPPSIRAEVPAPEAPERRSIARSTDDLVLTLGELSAGTASDAWTESFAADPRVASLLAEGWPVERLLVRIARGDSEVAAAALAALGPFGGRPSLEFLGEFTDHPELAPVALRALGHRGPEAGEILAALLLEEAQALVVMEWADRLEPRDRMEWAMETLDRHPRHAARLLPRIVQGGEPGLDWVLAEGRIDRIGAARVASALVGVEGIGERLARELHSAGEVPSRVEPLLEVCANLAPEGALPAVVQAARVRRTRDAALDALGSYPGAEPIRALFLLHDEGRLSRTGLEAQLQRSLDGGGSALAEVARTWKVQYPRSGPGAGVGGGSVEAGDPRLLLESCVLSERSEAVPVIVHLVECSLLDDDDRERALLAAGELAVPGQVELFSALFLRSLERDLEQAAASLAIAHDLGGAAEVETLWRRSFPVADPNAPAGLPPRVLELLHRAKGPVGAVARFRLTRELEDAVSSVSPENRIELP